MISSLVSLKRAMRATLRRAGARARAGGRNDAVSDVLGSILLVGITVVMAVVMAGLIFAFRGPENALHADLETRVDSGDGIWNNGNERIQVVHLGGEALKTYTTRISYTISGTTTTWADATLGSAFTDDGDGKFTIGEIWSSPTAYSLLETTPVDILVVSGQEKPDRIVASAVVSGLGFIGAGTGSCANDLQPPQVVAWSQVPANLQSIYVGTVQVTATVSDCTGVNQAFPPTLTWGVFPGNSPSGTITMTAQTGNRWTATIPTQVWSLSAGKTLQYYLGPLRDLVNPPNILTQSPTQSDALGPFTTYVTTNVAGTGTVSNFANAQSATDSNAEAALGEGLTGAAGSVNLLPDVPPVSATANAWIASSDVVISDEVMATTTTNNAFVRYSLGNQGATPGAINSVIARLEQDICLNPCLSPPVGPISVDDGWRIQACYNTGYLAGICSAQSARLVGTTSSNAADTVLSYDITNLRPGGGAWSWTDINNLELTVTTDRQGAQDGTWRADQLHLQVGYIPGYTMAVEFRWSNLPAGTSQTLQLNYRTAVDTFSVQVFDPTANNGIGAFQTRGLLLSSPTLVPWSYAMTAAEYNNGNPRILFVDSTPTGATQGNVFIEYARINTI